MTLTVSGTTVVNTNRNFVLGTATPGSPVTGMIRYNSGLARFEVYNGSAWVAMILPAPATSPAWGWGSGQYGRLGTNNTTNTSSPVSVVGGFTDWTQISAMSSSHTSAIRANGTAWGWGLNSYGRLGDGTTTSRLSPVSVIGGFTDWVQISAGGSHTSAIRLNGTAWSWGNNYAGKLGNNAATNQSSPVSVVGGFTDWVQISAGASHTSAIRANGTAWGWGYQASFYGAGKLGDNTKINRSSPVSVVGGFTDWIQISAGGSHTAALRANGTAWCWGYNGFRALGDGTTVASRISPVSVVGGFTDWIQISAGGSHTAAVRASGTAWCWGNNPFGQLGNGNTTLQNSPVSVVGGFTDWIQISAGGSHTAALRANGTAWAWGDNGSGIGTTSRLGDGTATNRSSPVSVVGGFTDWVQISAGNTHTAALRAK